LQLLIDFFILITVAVYWDSQNKSQQRVFSGYLSTPWIRYR